MSCFLQTPAPDNDLDLSSGNLVVISRLADVTAQKLTNKFQFFLGEWFIDVRLGIPYYQSVLVKNPNLSSIGQLFRRVILNTPGVDSITSASLNFISNQRKLNAQFTVKTLDGFILQGGPGSPFIVTGTTGGLS